MSVAAFQRSVPYKEALLKLNASDDSYPKFLPADSEDFSLSIPEYTSRRSCEIVELRLRDCYNTNCLPSPASSCERSYSWPDKSKATKLPSFKELRNFATLLPSPPSDLNMSSPRPNPERANDHNGQFEKSQQQTDRDIIHAIYPYNGRVISGEPDYPSWQPDLYTPMPPFVTSISPHEIHHVSYPATTTNTLATSPVPTDQRRIPRGEPGYVKRRRRRAEEVERPYACTWPGCDKAYGALNHLNTHVRNANHGPKREPKEFQEIRRELKAKVQAERSRNNASMYRHSGMAVFHNTQYTTSTTSPYYEYAQLHPALIAPYSGIAQRPLSTIPLNGPPQTHHFRMIPSDHEFAGVPQERKVSTSSPIPQSARWSPDNYSDLQARYPALAKELARDTSIYMGHGV